MNSFVLVSAIRSHKVLIRKNLSKHVPWELKKILDSKMDEA